MRYKAKVSSLLSMVEIRLNTLVNAIENNKPLTRDEMINYMNDVKRQISQVIEFIDLEYDDGKITDANLL